MGKNISKSFLIILFSTLIFLTSFSIISKSEIYNSKKTYINLEKFTLITEFLEILKENNSSFKEVNLYILDSDDNIKIIFTSENYKSLFSIYSKPFSIIENKKNIIQNFSFEECFDNKEQKFLCYIDNINTKKVFLEIKLNNTTKNLKEEEKIKIEKIISKIKENLENTIF